MATTPISAAKFLSLAKALYKTGSSVDARCQMLDTSVTPNLTRDYISTQEVLDYLSNPNPTIQSLLRTGGFPILVNSGGTLLNGVITGGTRAEYWFRDGVADANLILKQAAVDLSGLATTQQLNSAIATLAPAGRTGNYTDLNNKPDLTQYQLIQPGVINLNGITASGLQLTLPASNAQPVKWTFGYGSTYIRTTNAVFSITAASANKVRKDIIIAGSVNEDLQLVTGVEADAVAVAPNTPDGKILIATIDVQGSTVNSTAAQPVDLSQYATKIELAQVTDAITHPSYSLAFRNPTTQAEDYFRNGGQIKTIILRSGIAAYSYSLNGGASWVTPTLPLAGNIVIPPDTVLIHRITYNTGVVTGLLHIQLN